MFGITFVVFYIVAGNSAEFKIAPAVEVDKRLLQPTIGMIY